MIKWIDTECPECRGQQVFDNGHDEHCCQNCGEVFYVSSRDTVGSYQDYLELDGRDTSWHEGALAPIPLLTPEEKE